MSTAITVTILVFFIIAGILLTVFSKTIVSWLYEKTMKFWSQKVNPERKKYLDQKYQKVWYWKMWWLWSVWTYRAVGILVAAFFTILLIVQLTK